MHNPSSTPSPMNVPPNPQDRRATSPKALRTMPDILASLRSICCEELEALGRIHRARRRGRARRRHPSRKPLLAYRGGNRCEALLRQLPFCQWLSKSTLLSGSRYAIQSIRSPSILVVAAPASWCEHNFLGFPVEASSNTMPGGRVINSIS